jgi:hypothetical protein
MIFWLWYSERWDRALRCYFLGGPP